jgi:hypothetical protein
MRVIFYTTDPSLTLPNAVEHCSALGLSLSLGDRLFLRNPQRHKAGEREPADCIVVEHRYQAVINDYQPTGIRCIVLTPPARTPSPPPSGAAHADMRATDTNLLPSDEMPLADPTPTTPFDPPPELTPAPKAKTPSKPASQKRK